MKKMRSFIGQESKFNSDVRQRHLGTGCTQIIMSSTQTGFKELRKICDFNYAFFGQEINSTTENHNIMMTSKMHVKEQQINNF